jgi:outer membrane protein assembly factor BamD (BamD/ComL family)
VTKATKAVRTRRAAPARTGLGALAVGALCAALTGCTGNVLLTQFVPPWKLEAPETKPFPTAGPKDSLVLRGNGLEKTAAFWHPRQDDIEAGKRLLEQKLFADAEKAFHQISNDTKCPEQFREEALFLEAECQRLQDNFRGAEETYSLLFKDFPSTQFTERADRALFQIAAHWLEGTRAQMEAYAEQRDGKRWLVMPTSFVHFSHDMPVFDPEGHAVRVLDGVQIREKVLHTALGEQALLYLATLKFYREDYLDADRYFTDLYQHYPNGPKAAEAIKKSIMCKQLCTGGTMYDLRTVEESRKLIHTAQTAYPEFAKEKEWITQQLVSINLQQADRDFRVAEKYRWLGHPGSAYFYYELVRRCYPNTTYAAKAAERIRELEQRHPEAIRPAQPGTPPPGTPPPGTPAVLPGPANNLPAPPAPRPLPPSLAPPTPAQQ